MLNLLWKFFNAIGQIFILLQMGKYGKINVTIWSHYKSFVIVKFIIIFTPIRTRDLQYQST